MKIRFYLILLSILCAFLSNTSSLFAQLHFEGLVYNGQGNAILNSATAIASSPDGNFLYLTSSEADAVSVFYKNPDDGSLIFVEAEKNETAGVFGIGGANGITISPDGKHVYVAGTKDNAIGIFSRDNNSGTINYLGRIQNGINDVEDLIAPLFLTISGDGNHLYVTSPEEDALIAFKRNVLSGELSFIEKEKDGFNAVDGLSNPIDVKLSPNGKHVYATGRADGSICLFERNSLTGQLEFITAFQDGNTPNIEGLYDAYALAISPDGNFVYATSANGSSVAAFERNAITGFLSYKDIALDDLGDADGLEYSIALSLSPDGKYIYVLGAEENAIAIFSWNPITTSFNFVSKIENGVDGVSGLLNPSSIVLSQYGKYVYVTAKASGSLLVFEKMETGDLVFKTKLEEQANGINNLDRPIASVVSPDGNYIYVAAYEGNNLAVFQRDAIDGSMSFIESFTDEMNGIDGLKKIEDIAISPDGFSLYAAGHGDDAIVVFARNPMTGTLNYITTIKDNIAGVNGLDGIKSLVVSPDGTTLYAASYWENAIAVFARNPNTGTLSFLEMHQDGIAGVDGLALVNEIIVSEDAQYVYTISFWDDAISVFQRNTETGALDFQQVLKDGFAGVDGLDGGESICISPDGLQLYALGFFDNALAQFSRNPNTGILNFEQVYKNGVGGMQGLLGAKSIKISPDGTHVYVCSSGENEATVFARNTTDGTLSFEQTQMDGISGVNGIDQPEHLSLSPDGKYIYVCGGEDNAVAYFSCTYILDVAEVICSGDSITIGTTAYHETGVYTNLTDIGSCQTRVNLSLEVLTPSSTITKSICNGDVYSLGNNVYDSSGSYTEVFTNSQGCDSTVTLNLFVENSLTEELEVSICEGESFVVGTNVYTSTGTYSDQLVSVFGCDSIVNLDLTVLSPIVTNLNETICANEFFVMGTSNYNQTGTYQESFTAANACDSLVNLNLTVLESSNASVSATICANEVYVLGNMTYNSTGSFIGKLQNEQGCDSIVTLHLTVLEAPIETTNHTICKGATYWWEGNAYTNAGTYQEYYPIGNGCNGTRILNLTVQADTYEKHVKICEGEDYNFAGLELVETGVYTNMFSSMINCDSLVILYFSVIPAELTLDVEICEGDSYILGDSAYHQTGTYVETVEGEAACLQEVTLNLNVVETLNTAVEETICFGESYWIGNTPYASSGNYVDTILSEFGCDSIVTLDLTALAEIEISETIQEDDGNNSGAIELSILGGAAPYSFSWDNGATTQNIDSLIQGEYTVLVTDSQGCTSSQSYMVDSSVGLKAEQNANFSISIYPNPIPKQKRTMNLQFEAKTYQELQIKIFDSFGQFLTSQMLNIPNGQYREKITVPSISGVYFIQIIDGEGLSITRRFIVQ